MSQFKIGKIGQVAFVVRDLEARMRVFWDDFGIGAWSIYNFEPPRVKDMTYRGKRQDFRMRVANAIRLTRPIREVPHRVGGASGEQFE